MTFLRTLRARLLFTYLALIVLGFGGLTLLAGRQISASIMANYEAKVREQAVLLAAALPNALHDREEGLPAGALDTLIGELVRQNGFDVTLLDGRGQVLSAGAEMKAEGSPRNAAEIRTALQGNVGSAVRDSAQGATTLYVAAPMFMESRLLGVVWLAAPLAAAAAQIREQWLALGLGFLAFLLVGGFVSWWLGTTLTRPLARLRTAALDMATGDLTTRVADPGQDEIGAVGTAFNHMADQVEAMVVEQQAFASNASHELRTPLTAIRLRTEWLQSGELDSAETDRYIADIARETLHMSNLVDDLILLSRVDARRLEVGSDEVDLRRLTERLATDLAPQLAERRLSFTLTAPDEPLPPVQGNLNHLRVVCRNLLDNAVKYTPTGGQIAVTLSLEDGGVMWQVRDTGQGIALDDLPHVRKRFYRADKARTRQVEGVGLGLSLVESIVEVYGGRFTIDSAGLGRGTTARVWWPISQPI